MKLALFDYELPAERIAREPAERRDAARLFVHEIAADRTAHRRVRDLFELLAPGDLLVVNDTRVVPARLFARRPSGGAVELLLLEPRGSEGAWTALANPARKLRPGEVLAVESGGLEVRLVERLCAPDGTPAAEWVVALVDPRAPGADVLALLEAHGHVPLPPYLGPSRARAGGALEQRDRERYQTVYARRPGAVAAPTAGLHFTDELLAALDERGVRRAAVTLHVGAGTFRPIDAEEIEDHRMHAERFELPPETAAAVAETRSSGGRVVAVGTTSARVLESAADAGGEVRATRGTTDLYLHPGEGGGSFRVVDALFTNFHLPKSSLLLLVSAFAGRERILRLYREAIEQGYRFYSYGDAMLLVGRAGLSDGPAIR